MSYRKESTDDLLYDLFVQSVEFVNVLPNLQDAKTEQSFMVWFL